MRAWVSSLVHGRVLEIAFALTFGYAAFLLLDEVAEVPVSVLAQHIAENPYYDDTVLGLGEFFAAAPYLLSFTIGGTVIVYGEVLAAATTFALVGLAGLLVVRRRDRELDVCPFCASRIPYESRHCAYCGSGVEPGER